MRSGFGHLDEMSRYIVEDHCRNPRNTEPISNPNADATIDNPFCGDEVVVQLKVESDRIVSISVNGYGCIITQASASMMGELSDGKSFVELDEIVTAVRAMFDGNMPDGEDVDLIGDMTALSGVSRFPVRIKCALLAWATLEDALATLEG